MQQYLVEFRGVTSEWNREHVVKSVRDSVTTRSRLFTGSKFWENVWGPLWFAVMFSFVCSLFFPNIRAYMSSEKPPENRHDEFRFMGWNPTFLTSIFNPSSFLSMWHSTWVPFGGLPAGNRREVGPWRWVRNRDKSQPFVAYRPNFSPSIGRT